MRSGRFRTAQFIGAAVLTALAALWAVTGYAGDDATVLRTEVDINAETRADAEVPAEVTFDTWYLDGSRVVFDHALHVDGFEMACGECHHTEACGQCHLPEGTVTLIRDSQVSVHAVCFPCHEQEAGGETCTDCHVPSSAVTAENASARTGVAASPQYGRQIHDWLLESMEEAADSLTLFGEQAPREREAAEMPEDHIFVTSRNGVSVVGFAHKAHAEDYGLACASCHHLERCGVCHADVQRKFPVRSAQDAVMQNCVRCHEDLGLASDCESCHTDPHRR